MSNPETESTSNRKLVRCKTCDGKISRTARVCPHCGESKKRWVLRIVIALAFAWTLFHEQIHDVVSIPDPIDWTLHFLQKFFGAGQHSE